MRTARRYDHSRARQTSVAQRVSIPDFAFLFTRMAPVFVLAWQTKCAIPAENFPFCTIEPNEVREGLLLMCTI